MVDLRIEFDNHYEKLTGKKPLTWGEAFAVAGMPPDDSIANEFFTKHAKDCFQSFKAGFAAALKG